MILLIILLISLLQFSGETYLSSLPVRDKEIVDVDGIKSFSLQAEQDGVIYRIRQDVDLKGRKVNVPKNSVLRFAGGMISNGTIVGNDTVVEADTLQIFRDMSFEGTFSNKSVYSHWLDFKDGGADNRKNFDALMALAEGGGLTDVYIQQGRYFTSVGKHAGGIRIPEDTYVHNKAEICALPSSLEKYDIISISNVENVTFDGGAVIGDVGCHIGSTGEWGYGIGMTGARNCTVRNVHVSLCWGDGINIQALYSDYLDKTVSGHCYDILVENVICDDNRRQGMSIEGAIGVRVSNSRFINTGKTQATLPSAGIDIEPWYDTEVVKDIEIVGCMFENNTGGNLICPLTVQQWQNGRSGSFRVSGNRFDDNVIRFNRVRGLKFDNNVVGTVSGLLEFNQYADVEVSSNKINGQVSVYTEGFSEKGVFRENVILGNKRLTLSFSRIERNYLEGQIHMQEGVECVFRENHVKSLASSADYSFVCDNTSIKMSDNVFELARPMIFRYRSRMDIHDNTFIARSKLHPACLILQTARNSQFEYDGRITGNLFVAIERPEVNYSLNGIYKVLKNRKHSEDYYKKNLNNSIFVD